MDQVQPETKKYVKRPRSPEFITRQPTDDRKGEGGLKPTRLYLSSENEWQPGVMIQSPLPSAPLSASVIDDIPRLVRLKRSGGVVVQDCDVYIGREWTLGGWNLPQSKWANPFSVKMCGSAEAAVAKYRDYIVGQPELLASLSELKGKTIGCWCTPKPCHGDVLIELYKQHVIKSDIILWVPPCSYVDPSGCLH